MNYPLEHLCHRVFGYALLDMATENGNISQRLARAYISYLFKINWSKDRKIIPEHIQEAFIALERWFKQDLKAKIEAEKERIRQEYRGMGLSPDEDRIDNRVDAQKIIANLHWKTAQKVAKLMREIYSGLCWELGK